MGKCIHRSMRVRALTHAHVLCPIHERRFLDHRLRRRGHSKLAMSYLSRSAPCTRWNPSCVSANMKKSQCRCVHACERALMQTCTHVIAHECICFFGPVDSIKHAHLPSSPSIIRWCMTTLFGVCGKKVKDPATSRSCRYVYA